jgi:hypothetical protein
MGNEGRRWRISGSSTVLDDDLLKEKHGAGNLKGGEGALHLQIRHHVTKCPIEAAKNGEHEGVITDGITKLCQGGRHRLEGDDRSQ